MALAQDTTKPNDTLTEPQPPVSKDTRERTFTGLAVSAPQETPTPPFNPSDPRSTPDWVHTVTRIGVHFLTDAPVMFGLYLVLGPTLVWMKLCALVIVVSILKLSLR